MAWNRLAECFRRFKYWPTPAFAISKSSDSAKPQLKTAELETQQYDEICKTAKKFSYMLNRYNTVNYRFYY